MVRRTSSTCINCGSGYERLGKYHGYYCPDCRLVSGQRRGESA